MSAKRRIFRNVAAFTAVFATVLSTYDIGPASAWETGDVSRILITNSSSDQDNGCLNSVTDVYGSGHEAWSSTWASYPCTDGYSANYIGARVRAFHNGNECNDTGYQYYPYPAYWYGVYGTWCGMSNIETFAYGTYYDFSLSNYQYPSSAYSANH